MFIGSVNANSRNCSVDYKVTPITRLLKKTFKYLDKISDHKPVSVIGTRFEESDSRKNRMLDRGEEDLKPWEGKDGGLFISPIAHWDMGDVWEYLGACRAGNIASYSRFEETFRIYADATQSSCAVVADMSLGEQAKSRACGARHGCWSCVAVGSDKSLISMVENDERYHYMKGLNKLQKFLLNTKKDWSRRSFLCKKVNEQGYIKIQPDVYSGAMREELLRYALTLDAQEIEASQALGVAPSFRDYYP